MTQTLTPAQVADIKEKAKDATAGPWQLGNAFSVFSTDKHVQSICWTAGNIKTRTSSAKANTAFIAASNPAAILSLIATLEARDAAFDEMLAALKLADDLVIAPMRNRKLVMDEHRHTVDEAIRQAIAHAEKVKP